MGYLAHDSMALARAMIKRFPGSKGIMKRKKKSPLFDIPLLSVTWVNAKGPSNIGCEKDIPATNMESYLKLFPFDVAEALTALNFLSERVLRINEISFSTPTCNVFVKVY